MNYKLPTYYSELAPFRAIFEQGNPILTYHKLGPRPGRVRLKGLYLSQDLFRRHWRNCNLAGFANGSLATWGNRAARLVTITFDDGYVNVLRLGLEPLAKVRLKAIQFLPAKLLGKCNEWDVAVGEAPEAIMDAGQVREWIAAGHDIGSHSFDPPVPDPADSQQAREEISASRNEVGRFVLAGPIAHFCYPYGDWNEVVRDLVQEAGYESACSTDPGLNHVGGFAVQPETVHRAVPFPELEVSAIMVFWVEPLRPQDSRCGHESGAVGRH
jgi:peptidoglycan/xylan/chitin deacetylase (PgdA/CDA1 family)